MAENKLNVVENGGETDASLALMSMYGGHRIDFRKYRSFETLPREAWDYLDDVLIRTAKEILVGTGDLNTYPGTSFNFDGMSASVYTRKQVSEVGEANLAVSPDTVSDSAILDLDDLSIPMLVAYKDFRLNTKHMAMASRIGMPLDTALAEEATRSVARKVEDLLFNGDVRANGARAYGYTTFPQRQTFTIVTSWTTADPDAILNDVNSMVSLSMQANHYGPWVLYIPWQYQTRLNQDYVVGGYPTGSSIMDRLLQLPNLDAIKISNDLADDNVVLVEMSSGTVQMINGMPLRVLAWEPPGTPNWDHKFKVMTIAVPMLISDYKGQCGIVHGSTT